MSLDVALRETTRPYHERLHQVVDIGWMTSSSQNYQSALWAYWWAVAPCEQLMRKLHRTSSQLPAQRQNPPQTELLFDHVFEGRLEKSASLLADLANFGVELPTEAMNAIESELGCVRLPDHARSATLAGTGYVLEGMTLGAIRMATTIADSLQLSPGQTQFFRAYGSDSQRRWQEFKAWLQTLTVEVEDVVHAACMTFNHFERTLVAGFKTEPAKADRFDSEQIVHDTQHPVGHFSIDRGRELCNLYLESLTSRH